MSFKESLILISTALTKIDKEKVMRSVLEDLLTPQEIVDISERIRLLQELKKGKTQRVVAEELGISITTVNRGARIIKFGSGEIMKVI